MVQRFENYIHLIAVTMFLTVSLERSSAMHITKRLTLQGMWQSPYRNQVSAMFFLPCKQPIVILLQNLDFVAPPVIAEATLNCLVLDSKRLPCSFSLTRSVRCSFDARHSYQL